MAAYYAGLNESLLREIELQAERGYASQTDSFKCDTPSSSSNSLKDESTNYMSFTSRHDPQPSNQKQRRYDSLQANTERSLGRSRGRSQSHGNSDPELREFLESFQRRSEQLGNLIVANIRRLDVSLENVQRIVAADMEKKEEIHKLVKEMRELCRNFVGSNADMIDFFERMQTQTSRWERGFSELGEEMKHPPHMTDVERSSFSGVGGLKQGWNETTPTASKEPTKLMEQFPDKDAGPKELRTLTLHLTEDTGPAGNGHLLDKITWCGADIMTLGGGDLQRHLLQWGYKPSDHEILIKEVDVARRLMMMCKTEDRCILRLDWKSDWIDEEKSPRNTFFVNLAYIAVRFITMRSFVMLTCGALLGYLSGVLIAKIMCGCWFGAFYVSFFEAVCMQQEDRKEQSSYQ